MKKNIYEDNTRTRKYFNRPYKMVPQHVCKTQEFIACLSIVFLCFIFVILGNVVQ